MIFAVRSLEERMEDIKEKTGDYKQILSNDEVYRDSADLPVVPVPSILPGAFPPATPIYRGRI